MDDLFGMLYNDLPPTRKLLTAVTSNMLDSVDHLIKNGVDVNATLTLHNGNTALHISCDRGHHGCVKLLLAAGADPDKQNEFGYYALHLALRHHHVECARIIINTGCVSSNPMLIWPSQTLTEEPIWLPYTLELSKLLFKATSNFRTLSTTIKSQFYTKYLRSLADKELVKLYFITGNTLQRDELNQLVNAADGDMKTWLGNVHKPQALQVYARNEIRKYLLPNVYACADELPLPQKIKHFLLLEEDIS